MSGPVVKGQVGVWPKCVCVVKVCAQSVCVWPKCVWVLNGWVVKWVGGQVDGWLSGWGIKWVCGPSVCVCVA